MSTVRAKATSSQDLPKFLYPKEVERLLAQPPKDKYWGIRNYWMFRTMVNYGLRVSEAIDLEWSDIRIESNVLVVREGKGDKDRELPIGEEYKTGVLEYADRMSDRFDFDSRYVFHTKNNTHLDRHNVRHAVKTCADEKHANITRISVSPHTLRHTFAVNYYRKTSDLLGLQKLLGHSCMSTTLRYAKVMDRDLQERFTNFVDEAGFE